MQSNVTYNKPFLVLTGLLLACFISNISLGTVYIPFLEVLKHSFGFSSNETWLVIIQKIRLPKALTAVLVGSGLGISGLLMQTLFKNPLAGPYVLGISSGASLGVAVIILGSGLFGAVISGYLLTKWSIVLAASLGSFLVLLAVMIVSVRVKDTMAILIIGLMFGSITTAVVSVLSYFSSAEQLQQYVFWGFGSLSNLSWEELGIFCMLYLLGIGLSLLSLKALNSLLLGDNYAKSLGVNYKKTRFTIIIATSLLSGSITAFVGPIAFIGLAIPHLTRLWFKTANHFILMPAVFLTGALTMLICDTLSHLPATDYSIPINAVTALVGAPVVIWLLVRQRKMMF